MEQTQVARIGLIGLGNIGRAMLDRLERLPGIDIAFVHNRSPAAYAGLTPELVLPDLQDFAARRADLIVEMSHPDITANFGPAFLQHADYMPLSMTAFANPDIENAMRAAAARSGHRIMIPHGALTGVDTLVESRSAWADVTITFRKNPANIDFADSDHPGTGIDEPTVLYDGPARGIARQYPRNVNTMITCALATTGLDHCRAILIADPALTVAIAEVSARGHDGRTLVTRKEQPVVGVSGTEMADAQFGSILRALGRATEDLMFV